MPDSYKVFIDATCRMKYSSFYISGLYHVFGKKNVSFSNKYFDDLKRKEQPYSFDHYMAFVIISPNNITEKIIIDFCDPIIVQQKAYEWCDKYAKINFNSVLTDKKFHSKMISIPPGFGIRIWGLWKTIIYCGWNLLKCKLSPLVSFENYIKDYYDQFKRPTLEEYLIPENNTIAAKNQMRPYVFMIGTLWNHQNCIEKTNVFRKSFIEECNVSKCKFEGGLFASPIHPQYEEFKNFIFKKRYPIKNYIAKTKLSAFVFNTPAVWECHGWKLGEYLTMGKAIISMPLRNNLPEKLVHGKNIHFISNTDEMKLAIDLLLNDDNYRKILENGAKAYYIKHVDPHAVIRKIINSDISIQLI